MKYLLIILVVILIPCYSYTQSTENESIYVHTDKAGYVSGETIWFKAYVWSNFFPGYQSSNLIIELTDETEKIVSSKQLPVFNGTSIGNIDLPLSFSQGVYYLRAYTKNTLTENGTAIFRKTVYIFNPSNIGNKNVNPAKRYDFEIFPSSGKLLEALNNTIWFKATDQFGLPVAVQGTVTDDKNQKLFSFKDLYKGLGRFELHPSINNLYTIHVHFPDSSTKIYSLPKVTTDGVIINISNNERGKAFTIDIYKSLKSNQDFTVLGLMGNNIVFEKKISPSKKIFSGLIPIKELPSGLMRLFVLDQNKKILAFGATFINNETIYLPVTIKTDTLSFFPKGDNVFTLNLPDSIVGNLSISITDYDREIHPIQNNIISELLLNQESKNNSLVSYIDLKNHSSLNSAIMELMVNTIDLKTVGSDDLFKGIVLNEILDTNFISIKGKVFTKRNSKLLTKGDLNFIFSGKNSAISVLSTPIEKDGSFLLKNLIYYDTATFKYQLNSKRPVEVIIKLDSAGKKTSEGLPKTDSLVVDHSVFNNPRVEENAKQTHTDLTSSFNNAKTLKEVRVKANRQTPAEQINNKYTSGLFRNSNMARVLDLVNDPPLSGGNLFDYLQGKFSDLIIRRISGSEYALSSRRPLSLNYPPQIKIYLNEQQSATDFITIIPLQEIALVKYYPPGNSHLSGVGINGVLAIYIKKQDDVQVSSESVLNSFVYPGYSEIKEFDYSDTLEQPQRQDIRTTLYWNPYVFFDGTQKDFKLRFNNSDVAKRFHVIIEGFSSEGKLLHYDKIIEEK